MTSFDPGQIKEILLERDKLVVGGVDVLMIGKPGCGKTTGLAKFAMGNMERYNDIIIWRGSADCQWSFFLNMKNVPKMVLWLKEGLEYQLIDRKLEQNVDYNKYFSRVERWKNAADLVKRLGNDGKGVINIVETTPFTPVNPRQHIEFCRDWMRIFDELNQRMWKDSVTVLFDEIEDLVPEAKGKDFWDMELSLSSILRSLRKNDISSYFAGHSIEEIHWRIRKKIRWKIYMRGSKPEGGTNIRKNMNKLKVGEAYIEGDYFEKFRFESLGREHKLRAIINVINGT